ncbi:MAG: hypothetical protein K9G63_13790 [Melioribacteraceae bacterium]|nr:hypothetical protein [Melioribacteraceae bacterium]
MINNVKKYFIKPISSGLLGFVSFFSILVITKFLAYVLKTQPDFKIESGDIFLSLIGFVLVFLIRFLENFKEA